MPSNKKSSTKRAAKKSATHVLEHSFRSRKERLHQGESLREKVPLSSHAVWKPPRKHRNPIDILVPPDANQAERLRIIQ